MAPRKRNNCTSLKQSAATPAPPKRQKSLEPDETLTSTDDEVVKYDCETSVKIEKINYTWKINHLRFFHDRQKTKSIKSPEFKSKSSNPTSWELKLTTRCGEDEKYIGLFLYLRSCDDNKGVVAAKFKIAILNSEGNAKLARSGEHTFSRESNGWGFNEFVTRDYLFDEDNDMLPNDEVTFTCELEFASPQTVENATKGNTNPNGINVPECNISEDLGDLLKNKSYSDVTLSVNGKNYPAHKAILAARSSVFAAMFRHKMKESTSNRVEITDIGNKVFDELLRYIYTGKVNNLKAVVKELLIAANKYDLERLKNMCEANLCERLEAENAVDTLIMADMHNLKQLKKQTIDFIKTCLSDLTNTTAWKNMISSHPDLTNEIFCALATDG